MGTLMGLHEIDEFSKIRSIYLTTSETLVRIGLNLIFPTIQFTSKGLPGKLFFFA